MEEEENLKERAEEERCRPKRLVRRHPGHSAKGRLSALSFRMTIYAPPCALTRKWQAYAGAPFCLGRACVSP